MLKNQLIDEKLLIEINRSDLLKKMTERTSMFLSNTRSFLMVVYGPKKSGKKYTLLNQVLKSMHLLPADYLLIENKHSFKLIKAAVSSSTSKHKLIIIQNVNLLVKTLTRDDLKVLLNLAKQNSKKIILFLNEKMFIQLYCWIASNRFCTLKIDYLSKQECKSNLEFYKVNSVQFNGIEFNIEQLLENFYSILRKPKLLHQLITDKQKIDEPASQKSHEEDVELYHLVPLYSLCSLLLNIRPLCFLLDISDSNQSLNQIQEFIKTSISAFCFKSKSLNQFLSDLNDDKKLNALRSSPTLISINKFDYSIRSSDFERIDTLSLKLIFLISDADLLEKYKHLFKFKFKFRSQRENDMLVESFDRLSDHYAFDYFKDKNRILDPKIFAEKFAKSVKYPILIENDGHEALSEVFICQIIENSLKWTFKNENVLFRVDLSRLKTIDFEASLPELSHFLSSYLRETSENGAHLDLKLASLFLRNLLKKRSSQSCSRNGNT